MNAMPAAGAKLALPSAKLMIGPNFTPIIGSQKPGVIVPVAGAFAASSYWRRCLPNAPSANQSMPSTAAASAPGTTTVDSQERGVPLAEVAFARNV